MQKRRHGMIDFKDQNEIYQLIAGISGFTLIIIGCLIIIAPFIPALLLAAIFTLATWPAFMWLNRKLHSRTALSAGLMTLFLACCFIVPLIIIGSSLAESFTKVYDAIQHILHNNTSDTAKMLGGVDYVGHWLEKGWTFFSADKERLSSDLKEYAAPTSQKLIHMGGMIGHGLLDITLGVFISYFLFRYGARVAVRLDTLISRFSGPRGVRILGVTKSTLIGVVYGILGTASLEGVLAAFGLWISGVPGATFLGLLTFFLSFIPMGVPAIWIPAAIWLYTQGHMALCLFMLAWGTLVISSVDNFLKPYLIKRFIKRGDDMPLLLILLGVMGGIMAFGFIGVFIGPTILAITYSLVMDWSNAGQIAPLAHEDRRHSHRKNR